MIIHIGTDEKFLDGFIKRKEELLPEIACRYFVYTTDGKLYNVKSNVETFSKENIPDIAVEINQLGPQKVILHSLDGRYFDLIPLIREGIEVVWIFFGFEVFYRPENISHFFGPITGQALSNHKIAPFDYKSKTDFFLKRLKPFIKYNLGGWSIFGDRFLKAVRRIDYFAHWLHEDFKFIKDRYPLPRLKFIEFSFSLPVPEDHYEIAGLNNFLVGNSASPTNNHLESFELLKKYAPKELGKVIVPLNYSGSPKYVELIIKEGTKIFGEKFMPLTKFLTKDAYFQLLASVDNAVFHHYRSQGGWNMRYLLMNRKTLWLSEKNNSISFYRRKGFSIKSIEKSSDIISLSSTELDSNRMLMQNLLSYERVFALYQNLLS